jgi:drug/metabolite transporter (DMT)-like permease
MLAVQYTFFKAIETSNIASAALLQYLGPVFITVYLAIRLQRMPNKYEMIALILALFGTFFLITSGKIDKLNIPFEGFIWGISSAVFLAFYTIYPKKLIQRWGTTQVNGWAMLIGGIILSFIAPPWQLPENTSFDSISLLIFIILFGTAIPFSLYTRSILYIKPNETSILASSEPLTAAIISVIWLHVPFGIFEWVGSFCIILAAIILGSKVKS